MAEILGKKRAVKFSADLAKKYPIEKQKRLQTVHKNLELIKGKARTIDILAIKIESFEKFLQTESPELYQKYLERKKKEK